MAEEIKEVPLPQLLMRRENLDNLPPLSIPDGFTLRTYRDGDALGWEDLTESTLGFRLDFEKDIMGNPFFTKERVFFICKGEQLVATAIAWCDGDDPEKIGYVHMVGANPEFKGKGLGYQVSLATLHKMAEENKQSVILHTDDFRLPALAIYLRLGFKPDMTHESHEARWQAVYKALGISHG